MQAIHGASGLTAGLALGLTWMLSIGPNNILIMREGFLRGRACTVASAILGINVVLLSMSWLLADGLLAQRPNIGPVLAWAGVAAMGAFASAALLAAARGEAQQGGVPASRESLRSCLRRVAGVALFNPLMYLELLLVPAAICGTLVDRSTRCQFILGLVLMAALTCYGYALGGRACVPLFHHRRALQVFDLTSGLLLGYIAMSTGMKLLAPSPV